MKKFSVVLLLTAIVFLVLIKPISSLIAFQAGEGLRKDIVEHVGLTFQGVDTDLLDAMVHYEQVDAKIFKYKSIVKADRITLHFDSTLDMVLGLIDLNQGKLDRIRRVEFVDAERLMRGSSANEILADIFATPKASLAVAYLMCPNGENLVYRDWQYMGIDSWRFDLELSHPSANEEFWSWQLNIQSLGEFGGVWPFQNALRFDALRLSELINVRYAENGFVRRLNNYCIASQGKSGNLSGSNFPSQQVAMLKSKFREQSVYLDEVMEKHLATFFQFGGAIQFEANLASGVSSQDANASITRQTFTVSLNDSEAQQTALLIEQKKQSESSQAKEEAVASSPREPVKAFRIVDIAELEVLLGERVRVTNLAGKQYEGQLIYVDEFRLEVDQKAVQGNFSYNMEREELAQLEAWR